jgi:hypothetical protein
MIGHVLLVSVLFLRCDSVPTSSAAIATQENTKLTAIQERISKTSEDGLRIIERVKRLEPVVSEQPSAARLIDIVDEYSAKKGRYNIIPVGWEASQKDDGHWKIVFYYQDFLDRYKAAEWEYDEETNKLYPFERDNAPQFWTSVRLKKKQP